MNAVVKVSVGGVGHNSNKCHISLFEFKLFASKSSSGERAGSPSHHFIQALLQPCGSRRLWICFYLFIAFELLIAVVTENFNSCF